MRPDDPCIIWRDDGTEELLSVVSNVVGGITIRYISFGPSGHGITHIPGYVPPEAVIPLYEYLRREISPLWRSVQ